ncbi:hypothetical protein SAMN05444365_103154 [Micromonospora pattaloongensis]|uniref:Uncharacterized protein n=1 Tax=Micromonospora pattaloongensis TaxID=405436 RepID=A0A1H3LZQ6_9ACTN|nr:hypothetical protein SAMN05444365_103154 [Micromonospora pattaloongensis]
MGERVWSGVDCDGDRPPTAHRIRRISTAGKAVRAGRRHDTGRGPAHNRDASEPYDQSSVASRSVGTWSVGGPP